MSLVAKMQDALVRSPSFTAKSLNKLAGGGLTSADPMADLERFADSELSSLARDQVQDLRSNIANIADRSGETQAVSKAVRGADTSADVALGVFNRRTEGMGLSARQKMGARQRLNLGREVAKAAAAGSTRRGFASRGRAANQVITGLEDADFGQQVAMLTGLSNAYGQELINRASDKADRTQRRNQAIGTGLGILSIMAFSSEDYKDKVSSEPKLLDKLKKVRVDKWRYKGSKPEHIGPYAEEFNETFGVGKFKDAIDMVSLMGVTLGAVKELNEKVEGVVARG